MAFANVNSPCWATLAVMLCYANVKVRSAGAKLFVRYRQSEECTSLDSDSDSGKERANGEHACKQHEARHLRRHSHVHGMSYMYPMLRSFQVLQAVAERYYRYTA